MKFVPRILLGLSIIFISLGTTRAAVRFDAGVLWQPEGNSDVQVYLHASNVVYPAPRERAEAVFASMPAPDRDYPVLTFIAHHAGVDLGVVWSHRQKGHSWYEVMAHFRVSSEMLFVDLPRSPGPPWGKAWGHWRKHGDRMKARRVSDDDVRYWVGIRTVAAYAGISPSIAWERHNAGEPIARIAGSHFRAKNMDHRDHGYADRHPHGKGKGKRNR